MQLKEPLIINSWQKGIAPSPYLGFEEMRCVDINTKPGVAQINFKSVKHTGTTFDSIGRPIKFVFNGSDIYAITDSKVWKYTSGTTTWAELTGYTGSTTFYDIIIWQGYLMVYRGQAIDVYDIAGTQGWTNNWRLGAITTSAGTPYAFVGSDNKLYTGVGRYVEVLEVVAGATLDFDDSATYTRRSAASSGTTGYLDLPSNYTVQALEESNSYLMAIALNSVNGSYDIFRWDHLNLASSWESQQSLGSNAIHTQIVVNNLLYIIAGKYGTIYVSDGTNLKKVATLPESITKLKDIAGTGISISRRSICWFDDKIYFGVNSTSSTTLYNPCVIWSYNVNTGALTEEYVMSTNNVGVAQAAAISYINYLAFNSSGVLYYAFGDPNNTSYGIDYISTTQRYTSWSVTVGETTTTYYPAFIITQFIPLSPKLDKITFTSFECQLAKPLVTGDGFRFYYRTAPNGSWTQIGSDWTTAGQQSYETSFGATAENIQFKIEMKTSGSVSTSPELLYLRIK